MTRTTPRPPPTFSRNSFRPTVERLETRDCPTLVSPLLAPLPPISLSPISLTPIRLTPISLTPLNLAPTINLNLAQGSQKTVTLSGQVFDEHPGGLTVVFTGQYAGTTVTNPDGTFSLTVQAAALGAISAQTTDAYGLSSNIVQRYVTSSVPTILNFTATRSVNTVYIFTGQVLDESAAGLTVNLGGLQSLAGKTATVNSDGTFALTVELAPGEEGCATAVTTDWWGLASQVAEKLVTPA